MVARTANDRVARSQRVLRPNLFESDQLSGGDDAGPSTPCNITAVAKRRDGGTRYWCLSHKADATAKYGKPANKCRAADEPPLRPEDILPLDLDDYRGGVAMWGAVPAVYDTTRLPMDRGTHVHARKTPESKSKDIDQTFRAVQLFGTGLPKTGIRIRELDAIYYMVSSVFGFPMTHVLCSHCNWPHLDRDFFSVHPHQRHLCAGCGKHFRDSAIGIGNPIIGIRQACGLREHKTTPSKAKLKIRQADYPGGIQIWGSNQAFLWTRGSQPEEEGIHIHAFSDGQVEPELDETYGTVSIDGVNLDAEMVRILMAQSVMPSLKDRVRPINCPACCCPQFATGEAAFTPAAIHTCSDCGKKFSAPGRHRKTVPNPLPEILERLAEKAPRSPQQHSLDLLPEML